MEKDTEIIEKVKEFVKKECEKPESYYKGIFMNHFVLVSNHALQLAERENADKEIVEIAAWLHDIASVRGVHAEHHIVGSEIAEKLLKKLNYPEKKIEQVKHCILSHRASKKIKRKTKEAQIIADADALAHFDDMNNLRKDVYNSKTKILAKLERTFTKLSPYSKTLAKHKLEKARKLLK